MFNWTAYDQQKGQPGFEIVENLVQYACKKGRINVISNYLGQQWFIQLFNKYCEDLKRKNTNSDLFRIFLNNMNNNYRKDTNEARIVIDFIAGMTDDFFNNQYKKIFVPQNLGYDINQAKLLNM